MQRTRVSGLREVLDVLEEFEPKLAKKYLRQALRKVAKKVASDVESAAPAESGALANTVKVRAGKKSRTNISMLIEVGDESLPSPYVATQEFGSSEQPGQAFMRPSLDKNEQNFAAEVKAETENAIKKAAKRA